MNNIIKINIREWEEKELPEDLSSDTQFLKFIANICDRTGQKIFDISIRPDGKVIIKARNYVGIFMIKDSKDRDIALIVEPKIRVRSIIKMIAVSEARSYKELEDIETLLSISGDSIIDLLMISVTEKFLKKLSEAMIFGFLELPITVIKEGINIRGRVLTSELPRTLFASPIPKVSYELQVYTIDNLVNKYILDTCHAFYTSRITELLKILGKKHTILARTLFELDYNPSLSIKRGNISELFSQIPMDRPYLHELLRLALIIRKYLEYEDKYKGTLGELVGVTALYINMNSLFETFVRKLMTEAARRLREEQHVNIRVRKAGQDEKALVIAPKSKVYLVPDIVIECDGKPLAVGDVKYRLVRDPLRSGSGGDRNSIYQVHTYMHGWDVNIGFLIYPSFDNKSTHDSYMLKNGKVLHILKISADDEKQILAFFNDFLEKILQKQ